MMNEYVADGRRSVENLEQLTRKHLEPVFGNRYLDLRSPIFHPAGNREPGGFPPGVTPENMLWRQAPRNRRVAEVFAKCGLVERAGQGANLMFEQCIKESKPLPDFSDSDDYQVSVVLRGEVQDEQFLRFLQKIGQETLASFTTSDFLMLDLVHREQRIPDFLRQRVPALVDAGVIEAVARGRGTRYLLSRKFYNFVGAPGAYTRKRGLDRDRNKALLPSRSQT